MAKDQLARGAKSATFSAGRAKKDDPIEFHGTVALEEIKGGNPDHQGTEDDPSKLRYGAGAIPSSRSPYPAKLQTPVLVDSDESWQASEALNKLRNLPKFQYQPLNDRVLIRRVEEESTSLIAQPDAFRKKPTKGIVLAVGTGMIVGGQLIPIPLEVGDTVYFGEYGPEELEIEGEKLTLVSAFDIRLKVNAAS